MNFRLALIDPLACKTQPTFQLFVIDSQPLGRFCRWVTIIYIIITGYRFKKLSLSIDTLDAILASIYLRWKLGWDNRRAVSVASNLTFSLDLEVPDRVADQTAWRISGSRSWGVLNFVPAKGSLDLELRESISPTSCTVYLRARGTQFCGIGSAVREKKKMKKERKREEEKKEGKKNHRCRSMPPLWLISLLSQLVRFSCEGRTRKQGKTSR